jgi:hypothetical protein
MNKYVIYTAIFADYDFLKDPLLENNDIDFFCFTDNVNLKTKKWNLIVVENKWDSPTLANRYYKIIGFKEYFSNYMKSIYVDGSIIIKGNILDFFEKYNTVFSFFRHCTRNCIFDEYTQCLIEKRGVESIITQQISDYKNLKMIRNFGLSENSVIMRSHEEYCYDIMQQWWDEFQKYPSRDQISLPFILWTNGVKYYFYDDLFDSNIFFEKGPHNNEYIRKLWTNLRIKLFGTCLHPMINQIDKYQKIIRSK